MTVTLNAQAREAHGKGGARKLRAAGKVPVIVYGHGDQTQSLAVEAHDLQKLLDRISVENTVVTLSLPGGGTADVLIRDLQTHPVKANVIHVDFIQVHANEVIKLQVPVRLLGTPVGVRDEDGVLDQEVHDLDIECLPGDIPESAEVDVSGLHVGESVRVRDITLPGVHVLTDPDQTIATVHQPKVHAEAEADGAAATAPEVVRGGKSEES
ncbi:MAG: rplY [Gemmatimonadetes bacterium]|nr:rplY [Gemmatimonadota bacterium]